MLNSALKMSSEATTLINTKRQRVTASLAAIESPPECFKKWYFTGRIEELMVKQPLKDLRTGKITAMRAWCRVCRTPFFVYLQLGQGLGVFKNHLKTKHEVGDSTG